MTLGYPPSSNVPLGTSRLLEDREIAAGFTYEPGAIWLGRLSDDTVIGFKDDRHVCIVAGSRSGKGTTAIVNNLCLWPGSLVVIDPKGENATVAAARRGPGAKDCDGMKQTLRILDPFKASSVDPRYRSHFNPLAELDPTREETFDEAGRIAAALVPVSESSDAAFFEEGARAMIEALILHVITADRFASRRTLMTVRALLTRGNWEAVEALRSQGTARVGNSHELLWIEVANNRAFKDKLVAYGDRFLSMFQSSARQYESILQTADVNTKFIDSPAMERSLEKSDFKLADLKTDPAGVSIFLSLPQRYMPTHFRWLRLLITMIVTEMERVKGMPASGHRVLLLLDEFAGLKRLEVLEHAVAQIAGYGVKLFFVLQSLEQLKFVYPGSWETFLTNASLKIYFGIDDNFTREYASKQIGETEVVRLAHSSGDNWNESSGSSASVSQGTGTSTSDSTTISGGSHHSTSYSSSWGSGGYGSSTSRSYGHSQGWSRTAGTGTSQSNSETHGTSRGNSHGGSAGVAETYHRRAVLSPDEIGRIFGRVDSKTEPGYPGLALIVAGGKAFIVRRVNYFEDYFFYRCFFPHPDHPKQIVERERIEGAINRYVRFFAMPEVGYGRPLVQLNARENSTVRAGAELVVVTAGQLGRAAIRAPRDGWIEDSKLVGSADPNALDVQLTVTSYQGEPIRFAPFNELEQLSARAADRLRTRLAKHAKTFGLGTLVSVACGAIVVFTGDIIVLAVTLLPVAVSAFALRGVARVRRTLAERPTRQ